MLHGGQILEQTNETKDYFTICLRNINLNKKHKNIDLGIIYMVDVNDSDSFNMIPCKLFDGFKYKYVLVDGADRRITGKYGLIDFSLPSNNCEK